MYIFLANNNVYISCKYRPRKRNKRSSPNTSYIYLDILDLHFYIFHRKGVFIGKIVHLLFATLF